ncbi:hypothetical protein [Yoonia sp.]|uniref:hypothetical protein n=1 Tax=Yoonia sp. TaxID=2212373 RepID=UPI0025E7D9BC|nr:hypothetical protein [Yoonia sp.]
MPDPLLYTNGYSRAPKLLNGSFVQLLEDIVGFLPNVVTFQYNPETITRSLEPWNPMAVDDADRGSQAPTVQPFDVPEKFTGFQLEFDATDGMGAGHPVYEQFGIEPQLAALRKLVQASEGLIGDLTSSFKDLAGIGGGEAKRPTVAPTLLVLGKRVVLPVRITSFSVDEKMHSPTLYPIMATVSLEMEVMTPDMFRCTNSRAGKIAVAAYEFTRLREDASAVLNLANAASAVSSLLPI